MLCGNIGTEMLFVGGTANIYSDEKNIRAPRKVK
jgi:hypothetical protein